MGQVRTRSGLEVPQQDAGFNSFMLLLQGPAKLSVLTCSLSALLNTNTRPLSSGFL